jgi:type IV pilus assembly protein PilQ
MAGLSREPITFDYSEAEIREVIDMLAAKAGLNIIYGDDVSGTLTISLAKVPFDEAFKTILNVKGLAAQQAGDNILRIASPATFLAEQKKAMQQTRVFFLNYSRATDVKVQVDAVSAAEGRKANCNADDNNNALVVTDTPLGLDATARLIRSLDRVPKQVVIEAKLVEVSLDNSLDYGISWSGYGEKNGTYFGSGDSANQVSLGGGSPGIQTPASGGRSVSSPLNSSNGGSGVSLPANVVYGAFRLGKVASNYMFDAVITAAAKKGKAKVLSDPKVATLNNKEANINITTQIPYTTTEVTAATPPISTTKVTYLTTGIILKVTPTINSDGRISMKINPSVSQPSATITPVAGGAPGIDTRSADTNVIVKNGETIVIGGLIHDTQSEAVFKVPILGDIPLLGYLFKKKSVSRTRMELLIFVTPRIIED